MYLNGAKRSMGLRFPANDECLFNKPGSLFGKGWLRRPWAEDKARLDCFTILVNNEVDRNIRGFVGNPAHIFFHVPVVVIQPCG